jgi:hypothetical protein
MQGKESAGQLTKRVARAIGGNIHGFAEQVRNLALGQTEIEHRQRCVELLIEVFRDSVFLNAELDMLSVELQVRLDDPVVSIDALTLEQKNVGPGSPGLLRVQMPLRAADSFINQRHSTAKADTPGLCVSFQEFLVGQPG